MKDSKRGFGFDFWFVPVEFSTSLHGRKRLLRFLTLRRGCHVNISPALEIKNLKLHLDVVVETPFLFVLTDSLSDGLYYTSLRYNMFLLMFLELRIEQNFVD